jgi:hypothetical protein
VPTRSSIAAVTYQTNNGGRLGNNLLTYMHAKWISYHFDIPLLYKPFNYSDQLALSDIESHADSYRFNNVVLLQQGDILNIDRNSSTLYIIPYFPECLPEVECTNSNCLYFAVPWDDASFKEELRKCIRPKKELSLWPLIDNSITAAVHVRKTSNGLDGVLSHDFPDGLNTVNAPVFMDLSFAYIMPPDTYYIEAITYISRMFDHQPLTVYIISEDQNVAKIAEKYNKLINLPNITFICRKSGNSHDVNVLEDFFFLTQCDCLIRSESTYAASASKLGDYLIQITPTHHKWQDGHLVIDESKIIMQKNAIGTHNLWIWPHFGSWCQCKARKV